MSRYIATQAEASPYRARSPETVQGAIQFARESFVPDGAEGETVHLLCNELEVALERIAVLEQFDIRPLEQKMRAAGCVTPVSIEVGPREDSTLTHFFDGSVEIYPTFEAAAIALAGLAPRVPKKLQWQCSGCRYGFWGYYKEVCPACGRKGYWSGSVNPNAKPWEPPESP